MADNNTPINNNNNSTPVPGQAPGSQAPFIFQGLAQAPQVPQSQQSPSYQQNPYSSPSYQNSFSIPNQNPYIPNYQQQVPNPYQQIPVNQAPFNFQGLAPQAPQCQQSPLSQQPPSYQQNLFSSPFSNNYANSSNYQLGGNQLRKLRINPKDFTKEKYAGKEIAALIITINSGGSYDMLFQSVEQVPPSPDQYVSVFNVTFGELPKLYQAITKKSREVYTSPTSSPCEFDEIYEELQKLDGENVVINWECCGGCSDYGFSNSTELVYDITTFAIEKKFVSMFSDFSLKALIRTWDSRLGINPFVKVGGFSHNFTLQFDPQTLINSPFAQLQNVGELCEKNGWAKVSAMSDTILYSLKSEDDYKNETKYKVTPLTVVTEASSENILVSYAKHTISIGDRRGLAGHVMLEYENGGKILTSCGHWLELVKLDVSMESVLNAVQKKFGSDYANNLANTFNNYSGVSQVEQVRLYSNQMVQSSAPCAYNSKQSNYM